MTERLAGDAHVWLASATREAAAAALKRCCGSERWVERMLALAPFESASELQAAAERVWSELDRDDYLRAFAAHPEIGADLAQLRARFASTAAWSSAEQAGVAAADEDTLRALADANRRYRERFGYIFIICASGKSAREMLQALNSRLDNDGDRELAIAAREQLEITLLRLGKLGS